jgi:protein phosphatase
MKFQGCGRSEVGKVRENNEDRFYCDLERGIFVVADGVGGKAGGEIASGTVVEQVRARADDFRRLMESDASVETEREKIFEQLLQSMQNINAEVVRTGRDPRYPGGIATTTDLMVLGGSSAFILHVGDSRIYLIREDEIFRITRDHTFSEHLRDHPELRDRFGSPQNYSNVLTRTIGGSLHVEIDTIFVDLLLGDRLLLCTDGVTDYLTGSQILEFARGSSDQEFLDALSKAANDCGGKDNITALPVRIGRDREFSRDATRYDTFHRVRCLQSLELFSNLELQEIMKVLRFVHTVQGIAGEEIVSRGDGVDGLYVVMEGSLSVLLEGRELDRVGVGEHFGEFALFGDPVRSADVQCLESCQLLYISGKSLRQLVRQDAVLGNKLLISLLSRTSRRIQTLLLDE